MAAAANSSFSHTLGRSLANLMSATGKLVDLEADLARTEMAQKATLAAKDVACVAAGGALAYAGVALILAAVVNALATRLPRWLASLVVGLAVAGAGGLLVQRGVGSLQREGMVPRRTIATLVAAAEKLRIHRPRRPFGASTPPPTAQRPLS